MTRVRIAAASDVLDAWPEPSTTPDERRRAEAIRGLDDRRDFVAARLLGRVVVSQHTRRPMADVRTAQTCRECGGPHGRPAVVGGDVHVGWSRSAGVVAAVVASTPCAVDVESLPRLRTGPLPLDVLTTSERSWLADQRDPPRAFGLLWVRKEVLVKLGDLGLGDVGDVDVTPSLLTGTPVLGRTLMTLDSGPYDAVAAWCVT